MITGSSTSLQKCHYDCIERAMFNYVDAAWDDFFSSLSKKEMEEEIPRFIAATHEEMHTIFAGVLGKVCQGMGKDN